MSSRGVVSHINERTAIARTQLNKLKRFKDMASKTKLHLYKALIRPVLEYPPIPICNAAITNIHKLQVVQSKALRLVANEGWRSRSTNEVLHQRYRLEAFNQRIFNLASNVWTKLQIHDPEMVTTSEILDNYPGKEHGWWPRTSQLIRRNVPEPKYK